MYFNLGYDGEGKANFKLRWGWFKTGPAFDPHNCTDINALSIKHSEGV